MSRVLIIVNGQVEKTGTLVGASPTLVRMVKAMKDAIVLNSPTPMTVDVIKSSDLAQVLLLSRSDQDLMLEDIIWCPLTLDVPNSLQFSGQGIIQACRKLRSLRQRVKQLDYSTVDERQKLGDFSLPVVLTTKGPLYGEVIGQGNTADGYQQPVDLPAHPRKPLYELAYELLQSLSAPPAVYLLQFGYNEQDLVFDRLLPFPGVPAIASIGVQKPDLFTCHWQCLTNQPIYDLTIIPSNET